MPDRITDIYIWKTIERILFSPKGTKDINKWYKQYHKFALNLWELNPEIHKGKEYRFNLNDNIIVSFSTPFDLPKFSIDFKQGETKQSIHYDNKFMSELDLADIVANEIEKQKAKKGDKTQQNERVIDKQLMTKLKETDIDKKAIENILTSMIAHPALHHHFKDLSDYIRINFNTKNSFLLLYQVAFQLADYKTDYRHSDLKLKEFDRLVNIVEKHIKNNSSVSSGELFNLNK